LRGTSREITIDLRELARLFEVNAKANWSRRISALLEFVLFRASRSS
jgi:hypothetical protein